MHFFANTTDARPDPKSRIDAESGEYILEVHDLQLLSI
jgi:hypothetical protein